eukprot:COSAG05_NODE_23799_length_255_cov_1.115385_1_plen_48_part_10
MPPRPAAFRAFRADTRGVLRRRGWYASINRCRSTPCDWESDTVAARGW